MDIQQRLVLAFTQSKQPISGEELSHQLGLSRTAVWKHIKQLEALGFTFEASTRVGYVLRDWPDELMPALVKPHLAPDRAGALGHLILWAAERESTNVTAIQLASEGQPHGTVVTCGVQTGGKGRRDRAWTSPKGGMWFSILLRNPCALSQAADLTLLASLAVQRALAKHGVNTRIKWPNDILLNGRKLCGILAQMRTAGETIDYAVLGIGINANFVEQDLPADLQGKATTILSATGKPVYRPRLLADILAEIAALYRLFDEGGGFADIRDEWLAACATIGSRVEVQVGREIVAGTAIDVDDHGNLLMLLDDGTRHRVHSGEILFQARDVIP